MESLGTRPHNGSPALISAVEERNYGCGSSGNWMHEGLDWIDLAQDRDRWRALPNTVEKYVSVKCGKFLEYLKNSVAASWSW